MSFDVDAVGGYGSGSLGDVHAPNGFINSYAHITDFPTNNSIRVLKQVDVEYYNGRYHNLTNESIVGTEIMIVAFRGDATHLGEYKVCNITAFEEDDSYFIYTIDKEIKSFFSNGCHEQMITIPHFKNLTLGDNGLTTISTEDSDNKYGGYLVFKCSGYLSISSGGGIYLGGAGFPVNTSTGIRPLTAQESNGTLDTDLYAGAENSIAKDHLILNVGDGACWILARTIYTDGDVRIGRKSTFGVQYCRGAADSPNKPANTTNIGGSTICIVCQYWTGFSPEIIAKYRPAGIEAGRGLARAYLAINSRDASMIPDEGLYALDIPKTLRRLKSDCNIGGFGRGTLGSMSFNTSASLNKCFNYYLSVSSVSSDGYTLTASVIATDADNIVTLTTGSLVMVHMTQKTAAATYENGRFFLARVVSVSGSNITINHACTFNPSTHYVQIIVIPEFTDLTISGTYKQTPAWYRGAGGIFAIACSGTCTLSTAVIDLTGKGTFLSNTNKLMDNSNMRNRLPLGQGNGSAFILAKNLTLSLSTRIGGTYSGVNYGGNALKEIGSSTTIRYFTEQGGFAGVDGTCEKYPEWAGSKGWGGGGGINIGDGNNGGWFSNAAHSDPESRYTDGFQGAHIFIAADTITNFNLAAISTGGSAGAPDSGTNAGYDKVKGGDGGAGYGGGGFPRHTGTSVYAFGGSGGFRGGGGGVNGPIADVNHTGGGGAGACFIYCNHVANQSVNGIITI